MDIKDLSVRPGHENVATTMNLNQHVPVDMARESAQAIAYYILGQQLVSSSPHQASQP